MTRRGMWVGGLTLLAIAAMMMLGEWQLQRRAWKHDLIARVSAEIAAPPTDLIGLLTASGIETSYAHVKTDGVIGTYPAIHLFAPEGSGAARYRVIAPLDTGREVIILVDLGSISEAEKAALGPDGIPDAAKGQRHIEGILRPSETAGWFSAAPDVKGNRWYVRDVQAINAALKLPQHYPYVLQSETPNPGGVPHAIPFRPDLPDNHLAYAVTWFSLALALAVIYLLAHRRARTGT